ncbi:MAG: lysophospholipase [Alphaproteobacteria bacterium]|nr:lysophospholipase [Alphaproteobacteria bacterium]
MPVEHSTLKSRDGTELACRRWTPADAPKAQVLLVHGLAEHMGRYGHVGEALREAGYAVTGLELRGHGHSEGKRGFVERWSFYCDDVRAGLAAIGEPAFIIAHSMGGLVSVHTVLASDEGVRGLVTSNPQLGLAFTPPRIKAAAGRLLSRVLPSLSMTNELDASKLSRDPEVARKYLADPLVYNTITPRWFTEALKAMDGAHAQAGRLRVPLLMMLGDQDGLTDWQAGKRFYESAGSADKQLKVYEGFYHELFNEPEKARVLADVVSWLDERA